MILEIKEILKYIHFYAFFSYMFNSFFPYSTYKDMSMHKFFQALHQYVILQFSSLVTSNIFHPEWRGSGPSGLVPEK